MNTSQRQVQFPLQSNVLDLPQAKSVSKVSRLKKTADFLEKLMNSIFILCGFIAVAFVLLITVFLVISGTPAIKEIGVTGFLFGKVWASTAAEPSYGILPFILTSVYGTFGAILIGVPLGLMCAVFLAKMSGNKISSAVRSAVDLMSGIPSVVYGLVGMIFVVPAVRETFDLPDGANLFSAIIVLAIMILPSVISVSETAIRAVPKEYEEASLALGATQTETVFKITLPAAKSGILASAVLGIGRAIGEAMAVMMVSGNVANMPSLFGSVRFLTTAVASEMSYSSGLQRQALFSVALVLFLFIMLINLALNFVVKRKKK
jgi:phosphate transport system permease protein